MLNPFKLANDASKLSINQLQQALQHGTVPPYIGIPLLQEKVKEAKSLEMAGAQGMGQQPSVAQQVMEQAQQVEQGVPSLPTNLPTAFMAGGGIVAFADGGLYDDEEDSYEDRIDAARDAEASDLMNEYIKTFKGGIGQLPAAAVAAPKEHEGIASGDAADFVARIMHKESRGQRYGKDGRLLTSEKGAQGEMQVMPGTSRDPGYGVRPARDNSPDELARVGRDYANTLLAKYGDPKLAAIAYNMGPGATDKWLAAGADFSKLPKETQGYVKGFSGEDGESQVKETPYGEQIKKAFGFFPEMLVEGAKKITGYSSLNEPEKPAKQKAKAETKPTPAPVAAAAPAPVVAPVNPAEEDMMRQFDQAGERYMAEREAAAAAPAVEKVDQFADIKDLLKRRYANLEKQRDQDKYLALLQAGLGMMAGKSPHAFANIGAGGTQGIQALMASNKDRTAEENALLSGHLGLSKLGATAEQAAEMRKLRADMQKDVLSQRDAAAKASNALGQARLDETHAANTDRQMQAMEALAINNATKNMGAAYAEDAKEKIRVEAMTGLYSNPRYRKMFMERNGGLDPLTMLTKPATQAQSSNQGLYDRANSILFGK